MRIRGRSRLIAAALMVALAAPGSADFLYSPNYIEASRAVLARRYVDARALADSLLQDEPESFEAHAVLGQVHLWGEEDLGLAEFHLQTARRLLEQRFPPPLSSDAPVALHQEILRNLRQTVYLREQYAHSLEILRQYNDLYDPDLNHLRGWPLLKMGRFAEARAAVELAKSQLPDDDPKQVDLADTLGQLAYEQRRPREAEENFLQASLLETDVSEQPDPVYLTNLGEVYRDQLRFDQAEATWLEALAWIHPGTYAQPHQRLACLYASEARWSEALEQLEQAVIWRAGLWPQAAAHTRAWHLTSVGEVLLALGESEIAARVLAQALAFPDRQALSSGSTSVALAKRYLLYAAALQLNGELAWERQSWSQGLDWWDSGKTAVESGVQAAWARSQAAMVLSSGGLKPALAPYGPGAMQTPWLLDQLAEALGPGPTALALATLAPAAPSSKTPPAPGFSPGEPSARMAAADDIFPKAYRPYLSLLRSQTEGQLPEQEALASAALLARARRWSEALRRDPVASRRQGLSIPIDVRGSAELAEMLGRSPRFHAGDDLVLKANPNLSAILSDARGNVLARVQPNPNARALSAALHRRLFSVTTDWSRARLEALTKEANPGRLASDRLRQVLQAP